MNLMGQFTFLDSIQDFATSSALDGATNVATTEINGQVYFFVASRYDSGVQVLRMEGTVMVPVFTISDSSTLGLAGAYDLEVVTVGTEKFLVVTAPGENAMSSFRIDQDNIGTDGHLIPASVVRDNENSGTATYLQGAYNIETVNTALGSFVVTASRDDDAVSVFQIGANGQFTQIDTVADTEAPNLNLNGVLSLTIAQVAGNTFIYTGGTGSDGGISVFRMSSSGILTPVQDIDLVQGYGNVEALCFVPTEAGNFLVATDSYYGFHHVYSVGANGALTFSSSFDYNDSNAPTRYSDISELQTLVVDGVSFVLATATGSDALIVYGLDGSGVMQEVAALSRTEFEGAVGLTTFTKDGRHFLAVASVNSDRLTLVEIGAANDPLLASQGADRIVGMDGNDDIVALGGNDVVYGGRGDDVISGRDGNDQLFGGADSDVLIGGNGLDTLEGGAGEDVILGGTGFDMLSYAASVLGVTVNLSTGTASGGDAAGDTYRGMDGVIGSAVADALVGSAAANRLDGRSGNDRLWGLAGNDTIDGGVGNDSVLGGDGLDSLIGNAGNDSLWGEVGNDVIYGGANSDRLYGGVGNDRIYGGSHGDVIYGDAGDDTLDGGADGDVFVFLPGFGNDQIDGFSIAQDRLNISALPDINSLAEFQAAAVSFGGNTVLTLADGSSIYMVGVLESQFTAANFIF